MAKLTDEIKIPVKATLTIDEDTFRGCLALIELYAKQKNLCGMLIEFDYTGYGCYPMVNEIRSMEEIAAIYRGMEKYQKEKAKEDMGDEKL